MSALIEEEAMALAGEVITATFTKWMADLDTTEAVNDHREVLNEMAFGFGIKELTEDDLDLIEDLVDTARAYLDVGWVEGDEE